MVQNKTCVLFSAQMLSYTCKSFSYNAVGRTRGGGSGIGMLSVWHQAITKTDANLLSIGCLGTNLSKFEPNLIQNICKMGSFSPSFNV